MSQIRFFEVIEYRGENFTKKEEICDETIYFGFIDVKYNARRVYLRGCKYLGSLEKDR